MSTIDTDSIRLGESFVASVNHRLDDGSYAFELPVFDLYRDVHKGLRAELFDVTLAAGRNDAGDRMGTLALVDHVNATADLLDLHAHHEDSVIEPTLHVHLPELAERIAADHASLDAAINAAVEIARTLGDTGAAAEQRRLGHLLYLELSAFTGSYLVHQLVEERVVMPALQRTVGVESVIAMHEAIVGPMPPEVMARSLALMLPAMNVDDRTEMLGGMQQTAPAEAFAGVVALARSVLQPADVANLAQRLALP